MKKLMLAFFVCLALLGFVSAEIRINEVMYNPNQCSYDDCEYIEVYSNENVNISLVEKNGNSNNTFEITLVNGYNLIIKDNSSFFSIWTTTSPTIEKNIALADTDNIWLFYNGSLIDSLMNFSSFGAKDNGKTLQYCNGNWTENPPTPGAQNNCTQISQMQSCSQNWSCTGWSSCSNDTGKPAESQSCTSAPGSISLELDWVEREIINGKEFDILTKATNLANKSYDVKLWITTNSNETVISEIYDQDEDKWTSGTYYVHNVLLGPGNLSEYISLRIKEDYRYYSGNSVIHFRLRVNNGSIEDTIDEQIIVAPLTSGSNNTGNNPSTPSLNQSSNSNISPEGVIILGAKNVSSQNATKETNSIIYKSKSEYIKEYTPYILGIICIIIIILLLLDKKR